MKLLEGWDNTYTLTYEHERNLGHTLLYSTGGIVGVYKFDLLCENESS